MASKFSDPFTSRNGEEEGTALLGDKDPVKESIYLGGQPEESKTLGVDSMRLKVILGAWVVLLVLSRSVDMVLFTRLTYQMHAFVWLLSSVILPVSFLIVAGVLVGYKLLFTKDITPEMRALPPRIFILVAALDGLGNLLMTIPSPHVTGPVQVLVAQTIIPMNVLLSKVFLKARYQWTHYVGMLVVLAGVVMGIVPDIQQGGKEGVTMHAHWFWLLLLALAAVPFSVSSVYKEVVLKRYSIDLFYFMLMVDIFQVLIGLVTFPMVFSSELMGAKASVAPSEFGTYLRDGFTCLTNGTPACAAVFGVFAVYLAANFAFNFASLAVVKKGSATLLAVSSAMRVPLSALFFSVPFMAGRALEPLDWYTWLSFGILTIGMILYQIRMESNVADLKSTSQDAPGEGHVLGASGEYDFAA